MADFYKLNVLVFEEYSFTSNALVRMLKTLGLGKIHNLATLADIHTMLGENATLKPEHIFDLAIIDLTPPNNHGLNLLSWLRNHESQHLRRLPIIFTTNDTREKIIIQGRDSGANEILVKPITAQSVSTRILNLINNPRPFINAPKYKGPDRRRRTTQHDGQNRRTTSIKDIEVRNEQRSA